MKLLITLFACICLVFAQDVQLGIEITLEGNEIDEATLSSFATAAGGILASQLGGAAMSTMSLSQRKGDGEKGRIVTAILTNMPSDQVTTAFDSLAPLLKTLSAQYGVLVGTLLKSKFLDWKPVLIGGDTPTDKPTYKPTEKATDQPTDKPTEQATNKPTDQPTDKPTEKATDQPTDKPTEKATDQPTEKATDQPTEKATDQPTEKATDQPTEKPTEQATDKPTEQATDKPTDQPTDKPTEQATDKPTDKTTDKQTDKPTEKSTDKPTDKPTEKATDQPTDQPTEQATDKPIDEPTDKPTEKATDKPTEQATDKPTEKATDQPTATVQATDKPTDQPAKSATECAVSSFMIRNYKAQKMCLSAGSKKVELKACDAGAKSQIWTVSQGKLRNGNKCISAIMTMIPCVARMAMVSIKEQDNIAKHFHVNAQRCMNMRGKKLNHVKCNKKRRTQGWMLNLQL